MTGRDRPFRQRLLRASRELEKAEGVGNGRPALAHARGHLLVGETELVDELLIGRSLFERVEVDPVQVLHESLLEAGHVVGPLDEDGDGLEPRPAGRPPAPLPRDQLVALDSRPGARGPAPAGAGPTALIDAASEAMDSSSKWLRGWKALGRMCEIGTTRRIGVGLPDRLAGDESAETLTESAAARHCSPPWPARGRPRRLAKRDRKP